MAEFNHSNPNEMVKKYMDFVSQHKKNVSKDLEYNFFSLDFDGVFSKDVFEILTQDINFDNVKLITYQNDEEIDSLYKDSIKTSTKLPCLLCGIETSTYNSSNGTSFLITQGECNITMIADDRKVSMKLINASDKHELLGQKRIFSFQVCNDGVYKVGLIVTHDIDDEIDGYDPFIQMEYYPNSCFEFVNDNSLEQAKHDFAFYDKIPVGFEMAYRETKNPYPVKLSAEETYKFVNHLYREGAKKVFQRGNLNIQNDAPTIGSIKK